ncbi:hypothetical protein BDP27DRAFT_1358816 [Rhodocollybia butyracea]|uniref:Uncharacterized protein n=1 Tax=Rhodocollybia butyracea TaxID=206335 RepID=A0A9P5UDY3_9AGAR|nr:hypothetical protein BDP27DRAFT_1358816 [Rhodocollybia butyracea]
MTTPDAAVPRLVVVDDTDPNIRYSPSNAFSLDSKGTLDGLGWGGKVFNQTVTGTTVNASLSYTFNGTFVRAMVAGEGASYAWNCSVDGHTITSFLVDTTQVTNYIACDSAGTLQGTTGQHTLDVNFYFPPNANSTSTQSLWLDSIQYQPLASDPLDSVTLRIHNSDPSVRYANSSGGWFWQGAQTNATDRTGTSMDFSFNGSSVTLYTVVFGNETEVFNANTAFYSLDGNSTFFDLPGSMISASTGNFTNIQNYPLFTVSNLSPSPHDIEVATSYNASTFPQYLAIDYFLIKTNPHNSSSPESPGNSSSGSNGSSSNSSNSGSSHKNIAAIAGGTVAGVAGLAALFLVIFFLVRRQKERKYSGMMLDLTGSSLGYCRSPPGPEDPTLQVTPFNYGSQLIPNDPSSYATSPQESTTFTGQSPTTYNPYAHSVVSAPLAGSSSSHPVDESVSSSRTSGWNPSRFVTMNPTNPTNPKDPVTLAVQDEQIRRSEIRQHMDSGVRMPSADDTIVDVPPTYTEA